MEQSCETEDGGASFLCLQKYLAVQWWSPAVAWVWGMSLYVHAGSDTSGRWGAPQTPPGQTRTTVQNTWRRVPSPSHSLQTVFFAWARSYWKCHWQVLSVNRKERNNPNHTYEKQLKRFSNFFMGKKIEGKKHSDTWSWLRPYMPFGAVSWSSATMSCNPVGQCTGCTQGTLVRWETLSGNLT